MKVSWSSPSNIALVKYWGKYGDQLPCNPSLSFTLKNSLSNMSIEIKPKVGDYRKVNFFFEGKTSDKFSEKIQFFLSKISSEFSWVNDFDFIMESSNTFPHSSGIASSASSMSALALSLLSLDCKLSNKKITKVEFYRSASSLARRASGSASRSVFPHVSLWGKLDGFDQSSDEWALDFKTLNDTFLTYADTIIIVDANEKSVSSRAGHDLMLTHPFREVRFNQARANIYKLINAFKKEDFISFIEIVEEEALTLHAMMMTSNPSYILLKPESLFIVEKVKEFRRVTNLPLCFTIDAGPNIHLLYPKKISVEVNQWLEKEILSSLKSVRVLFDEVGTGPVLLNGDLSFE